EGVRGRRSWTLMRCGGANVMLYPSQPLSSLGPQLCLLAVKTSCAYLLGSREVPLGELMMRLETFLACQEWLHPLTDQNWPPRGASVILSDATASLRFHGNDIPFEGTPGRKRKRGVGGNNSFSSFSFEVAMTKGEKKLLESGESSQEGPKLIREGEGADESGGLESGEASALYFHIDGAAFFVDHRRIGEIACPKKGKAGSLALKSDLMPSVSLGFPNLVLRFWCPLHCERLRKAASASRGAGAGSGSTGPTPTPTLGVDEARNHCVEALLGAVNPMLEGLSARLGAVPRDLHRSRDGSELTTQEGGTAERQEEALMRGSYWEEIALEKLRAWKSFQAEAHQALTSQTHIAVPAVLPPAVHLGLTLLRGNDSAQHKGANDYSQSTSCSPEKGAEFVAATFIEAFAADSGRVLSGLANEQKKMKHEYDQVVEGARTLN
ncbi:unnamed protein product, partial [Chrysoparadoxa australica]